MRATAIALTLIVAIASCDGPGGNSRSKRADLKSQGLVEVGPIDETKIVAGQTIFVPACSHVYTADNAQPLNLATTLIVRNTDPDRPIVLVRVRYHDSRGKLVRELVKTPSRLAPLASAEFFVGESDDSGEASPSFLVEWVAEQSGSEPLAETVMISTAGTQGISFTWTGRVIRSPQP
ncbi:DUF3124 domain-containing protein [Tundrisphaera lichenicola]|uniref:DUF3124 domain-containing protein n=1 Tax=Tundrisphaera lichenicola TaxID=2029860 RepID=UPI003EBA3905